MKTPAKDPRTPHTLRRTRRSHTRRGEPNTAVATPRAEILAAAARAIATHGYHGMSMRELARATGRALASFYSHYAAKEDVLFDLQRGAFETLISSLEGALGGAPDPVARLYVFVFNHVRYVAEHGAVMHVLVHEAGALPPARRRVVRALKERYFRIARAIVAELLGAGCGAPETRAKGAVDEPELERITYSIFGMLNWTYGWYDAGRHGDAHDVARTIHRIALCGLQARCPHRGVQDAMDRYLVTLSAPPLIDVDLGGRTP
jgi:AcrR family transcriptional regulator